MCCDWCILAVLSQVHSIQPHDLKLSCQNTQGVPITSLRGSGAKLCALDVCQESLSWWCSQKLLWNRSESQIWNSYCTMRSQLRWQPRHVPHCWMQDRMKLALLVWWASGNCNKYTHRAHVFLMRTMSACLSQPVVTVVLQVTVILSRMDKSHTRGSRPKQNMKLCVFVSCPKSSHLIAQCHTLHFT